MIRDHKKLLKFEQRIKKSEKINIKQNFALLEAMYKEALALKILPLKDPLEGLEVKIKIAKAVNSVPATPHKISH